MGWVIYFITAVLLALIFIKFSNFKRLWPMGLITILFLYLIDSTLISLGAYSFRHPIFILGGNPLFYLLCGFPGGILLAYFYPHKKQLQFPYILLSAILFIILEIIMKWFGYIQYNNWNVIKSYFLDISAFMAILWIGQWIDAVGNRKVNKG